MDGTFMDILRERLNGIAESAVAMLPQLTVTVILLLITWIIANIASRVYGKVMSRSRLRPSLVSVFQKLITIFIWFAGILISATVLFPDLTPGNLVAGLGLGSVAIGLAFKDTFENFLAGILILAREPMRLGDFIECEGVEGKVEYISIRDTYIRKTNGELVLVPNGFLFKNPLYVVTDKDQRRETIICGIAYDEDVDEAREVIRSAVEGLDTVDASQPVQIFAQAFGDSSINFEVTWWTGSTPVDTRASKDKVVAAVKRALDEAGIEIPFPYRTLTFKEPLNIQRAPDGGEKSDEGAERDKSDASGQQDTDRR
ncbi:MAG: mechanosensitive ion channel family protein [Alphaproteobacteria bacterium]